MSCPYCTEPFYPKKVAAQLALQSNEIHPALCFGRNASYLNDIPKENFMLAFFATRTHTELQLIWDETEKVNMDEVHICFFKRNKDGYPTLLSDDEIKEWDFSTPWIISSNFANDWDELRDVPIGMLRIVFKA